MRVIIAEIRKKWELSFVYYGFKKAVPLGI